MNGLPYYKAYPRDFIEGTIGMSFELKGAYRLVLDLIYMQGGELPDDARYISGLLGCTIRKWKSLRKQLVESGKIEVSGELLTNKRAVSELETLSKLKEKQAENRNRPNKNNNLQSPNLNHTEPESDKEKELLTESQKISSPIPKPKSDNSDLEQAVNDWNELAGEIGLSQVQRLTNARQAKLKTRLTECGGLDGWRAALAKIRGSPFLCGENDRNWKADFDFVLQQSSFTKLMEGVYDGGKQRKPGNSVDEQVERIKQFTADYIAENCAETEH